MKIFLVFSPSEFFCLKRKILLETANVNVNFYPLLLIKIFFVFLLKTANVNVNFLLMKILFISLLENLFENIKCQL